jgi:cytochrome c5
MRALSGEEYTVSNRFVSSFLALILAGATCLVVGGAWAVDLTDAQRAAIEERIKPAGQSCLEGDSACGGAAVATAAASGPRSGEEVYNSACMACHGTGAGGAPKVGDTVVWADRIAKGMDVLYESGVNGIPGTAMMVKGGCMDCSDEEFNAAVDYMVAGSQ